MITSEQAAADLKARQEMVPSGALLLARSLVLDAAMAGRLLAGMKDTLAAVSDLRRDKHVDPRMQLTIQDMRGYGGPPYTTMIPLVASKA